MCSVGSGTKQHCRQCLPCNLLCSLYPCQSILVHEFGHAVMNLGMGHDTRERLQVRL